MQAAISSSAADRVVHASGFAHNAWVRFMAHLSGAATSTHNETCTSNSGEVESGSGHSRKHKMLQIAADMLERHEQLVMLVLAIDDLPELECVFGHAAAKQAIAIAARKLGSLPRRARAIRTGPALLTVLLPDWDSEQAMDAVCAAFGKPCCIELEVDGQGVLVLPELAVRTVDCETSSIENVYLDLCRIVSLGSLRRRHPHRHHHHHHHSHEDCIPTQEKVAGGQVTPRASAGNVEPGAAAEESSRPLPILEYPPMPPTVLLKLGPR